MFIFPIIWIFSVVVAMYAATLTAGVIAKFSFPLPPADRRVGAIDGLRGYLALSVMTHHFFIWTQYSQPGGHWDKPPLNILNQLGAGSVALFFMTTGLVFYPRILKGLNTTNWSAVYITRFFRIVPLVAASVLFITLLIMVRTGKVPGWSYIGQAIQWISTWDQPDLMGYPNSALMNAMVFWSLRYEWLFYILILPLSAAMMDVVRLRSWPSWTVPIMIFLLVGIFRVVVILLGGSVPLFAYLSLFSVGMIAYECQKRAWLRDLLSGSGFTLIAIFSLFIGMTLAHEPYSKTLLFFSFTFIVIACGNGFFGLLRTKGALVLGECSFGIYLLHGILLNVAFVDLKPVMMMIPVNFLPLILPVLMIVATLLTATSYLIIELPAIRAGKRFAARVAEGRVQISPRELEVAP